MNEPRLQGSESRGGGGFIGREGQPLLSLKLLSTTGAASNTYSAEYPNGQRAVVKQLKLGDTSFLSHFEYEAANLQRLKQAGVSGVPRLHHAVIDKTFPTGTYLVMDYVKGTDDEFRIRDAIKHENPLKVEEAALRLTKAIAEIITAAYKAGVDYRDLKGYFQGNIFVDFVDPEKPTVTILDWGLANLGEPKNDSDALAIPWVANQLGALFNLVHYNTYNEEGELTASAAKALAALSPRTRNILARAFYNSSGKGYRSGDELIRDLNEALQHISEPFVPASTEEISQLFPKKEKIPEQQFSKRCSERITEIRDDPAIPQALRPTVNRLVGTFYGLLQLPPEHWSGDMHKSIDAVVDPAALPEHIRTGVYEPIRFMVDFIKLLRGQPDSPRKKQQLAALGLPQSSAIAEYLLFGENTRQESLRRIEEFFRENIVTIKELGLTVPQALQQFVPADKIVAAPPIPIAQQEVQLAVVPEARVQTEAMKDMARLDRTPEGVNFAWTVFGNKTDIGKGSPASQSAIDLHDVARTGIKSSLKELDHRIAQITDPKIKEDAIKSREISAGSLSISFKWISDLPLRQLYGDSVPSRLVNLFAERLGFTRPGEWVDDVNNPKLEQGRNEFRLAHPDKPFTLVLPMQGITNYGRPKINSFSVRYTPKQYIAS